MASAIVDVICFGEPRFHNGSLTRSFGKCCVSTPHFLAQFMTAFPCVVFGRTGGLMFFAGEGVLMQCACVPMLTSMPFPYSGLVRKYHVSIQNQHYDSQYGNTAYPHIWVLWTLCALAAASLTLNPAASRSRNSASPRKL